LPYIEDVKDRLDIVEVVGSYLTLDRKGRIYKCSCPFHHETAPSFIVFPDSQRWQCFGSCNEGGDVFDFVQKLHSWDFGTALKELCRKAGLELPQWSDEEIGQRQAARNYGAELEVVAGFFRQQIAGENEGRAYARKRGFSDETIDGGLLGYAPPDARDSLKGHISMHEMALDGRAALVALKIQGYAYHKGGALVYIHQERGRVVYLSARAVRPDVEPHETKYNPPINRLADDGRTVLGLIAGPKRPLVVGKPVKRAETILIVEGQACALTAVAEWGAVDTAFAIAGADLDDQRIIDDMAKARQIYVGLDYDATGLARRGELAERLGALVRVVSWPQKDANDLQRIAAGRMDAPEGFDVPEDVPRFVRDMLRDSPTWLDLTLAEYQEIDNLQDRAEASEQIAELYGDLPRPIRMQFTDQVCEGLKIGKRELNGLVRMVMERRLSAAPYATRWGMICRQNGLDEDGAPKWTPLAPLDARVTEEVVHDNGVQREIHFQIKGTLSDGYNLPTITVNAEDYNRMNWLTGRWGAKAYAMEASPHHLRRAILELSEPERKVCYTHIGWREIGANRVFLFNGGGVGSNGVEVDVEVDDSMLAGYVLPEKPQHVEDAMRASLRFLNLTDLHITGPLWAAMYLAPLSEIVEPDFVIFFYGKTGTMKSTITALALNHYGSGWSYNRMPASWNDTRTALEMKAFLIKDAPLVVDDYARDVRLARDHDRKAEYLIRQWANRTGRARRRSNLTAQQNFPPRGLIISSGEQLPSGQSIIGRSFPVEIVPADLVDNASAKERLNQCQAESHLYPHALAEYLLWLRDNWDVLRRELPAQWADLRDNEHIAGMQHQRIPAALAKLYIGFDLAMQFYTQREIITGDEAQDWRNLFFEAMKKDALAHSILVEEEDPIDRFVRIMTDSFAQGRIWCAGAQGIQDLPHEVYAEKIGFVDQDWLYLLGEAMLTYVQQYCRSAGDPFPLNRNALYSGLVEAGIAIPGTSYTTIQYKVAGNKYNVLKVDARRFGLEPKKKEELDLNGHGPQPEPPVEAQGEIEF